MRIMTKQELFKTLAKCEIALNYIGYIPMISILSAPIRGLGGKIQAILGFSFAIFSLIAGFNSQTNKIRYFFIFKTSIEHFIHGLLNIVRAMVEIVPFLSLVICLPYDHYLKKRFRYSEELTPPSDTIEGHAEEI